MPFAVGFWGESLVFLQRGAWNGVVVPFAAGVAGKGGGEKEGNGKGEGRDLPRRWRSAAAIQMLYFVPIKSRSIVYQFQVCLFPMRVYPWH